MLSAFGLVCRPQACVTPVNFLCFCRLLISRVWLVARLFMCKQGIVSFVQQPNLISSLFFDSEVVLSFTVSCLACQSRGLTGTMLPSRALARNLRRWSVSGTTKTGVASDKVRSDGCAALVPACEDLPRLKSAEPLPKPPPVQRSCAMESNRESTALLGASVASFVAGAMAVHWLASGRRRYVSWASKMSQYFRRTTGALD